MNQIEQMKELMSQMLEMQAENRELKQELLSLKETISSDAIDDRIKALLKSNGARIRFDRPTLKDNEIDALFWACTPKQHSVLQLILNGYSNQDVAERLEVSLTAAKSLLLHLCKRLMVNGRDELKVNYMDIWRNSDTEIYLERAHIAQDWAKKYGKLTFKEAKKKDPFYTVYTARYRAGPMPDIKKELLV